MAEQLFSTWDSEEESQDAVTKDENADRVPRPADQGPAFMGDRAFFRSVISFAGWGLILSIGAMFLLAISGYRIPEGIVAASSGLVGLLAGIFAVKTSSGSDQTTKQP